MNKEVLVISVDAIPGESHLAAGPGIRYYQIARSLALDYGFGVTLAVPQACYEPLNLPFAVVSWDWFVLLHFDQRNCSYRSSVVSHSI